MAKKRYIAINLRSDGSFSEEELKRALYKESLKFFGEYLSSFVALKLISFDVSKRIAVIRCNKDFVYETLGFLALINSLDGKRTRTVAFETSGTIKGLERKSGIKVPKFEKRVL